MKKLKFLPNISYTIYVIFILFLLSHVCVAIETNESLDAAGRITVTDVVTDPSILMIGDVGMITFTVENTGSKNVVVSDAHLISKEITVLNSDIYKTGRTIGAGTKMKFSFTILADQPENIYYPAFYLNFKDAGSLRYNVPIKVEEPQLALSVAGIPESFTRGVSYKISLLIGNAKSVNMTGVTIIPSGNGIQCNRTSFFIGDIGPHAEKNIVFEIIPSVPTDMVFNVSYTCGMNTHHTSYTIPITLGIDKRAAEPILNNIVYASDSSGNKLSGDVSNAGLSDAYGVIVSVDNESENETEENPNHRYVIGTIESGDFSSFEITLPGNQGSVTLAISYKDSSGNLFTKKTAINMNQLSGGGSTNGFSGAPGGSGTLGSAQSSSSTGTSDRNNRVNPMNPLSNMGKGLNGLPVTELIYVIIGIIGIFIIWRLWKRKMKGKKIKFSFR
jgi:hypothetical protein